MSKTNSVLLACGFVCLFVVALYSGMTQFRSSIPLITHFAGEGVGVVGPAVPTVAILFQPQDCSGLIDALQVWNASSDERKLNVVGRIHNTGGRTKLVEKIIKGSGITFPVQPLEEDALRRLRHVLGYQTGSLVLVFDPRGQLRMAVPLRELSTRQARHNAVNFARALGAPSGE